MTDTNWNDPLEPRPPLSPSDEPREQDTSVPTESNATHDKDNDSDSIERNRDKTSESHDSDRDNDSSVIAPEQGYTGYRPPGPDASEYSLQSGPDSPLLHDDDRTRTEQASLPDDNA